MNMSNTTGPPMIATVPEATSANAQASSKLARSGFHKVAFGISGSTVLLVRVTAVHDQCRAIERLLEEKLVAFEFQAVGHDMVSVGEHAVRGDDDVAFDPKGQGAAIRKPSSRRC
jgi:hypothetical protein